MKLNLIANLSEEQQRILAAIAENPCCTGITPTGASAAEEVDTANGSDQSNGKQNDDQADPKPPAEP